jgi:putative MATE family efflux protein
LLTLSAPTILVSLVQTAVSVFEIYFIGFLGPEPLAGVSLVFPVLMLMLAVANAGIGSGVAMAVARFLGAGSEHDANAIVLNSMVVALVFGVLFAALEFFGGRALYTAMGGRAAVLDAALIYGDLVFFSAILYWIVSLLSAALRGSGNTTIPALVSIAAAGAIPLTPLLVFGWGPFPPLGIAGAGVARIIYSVAGSVVLIWYLRSRHSRLRFSFDLKLIQWRYLRKILGVGTISTLAAIQSNVTSILVTGLVGLFGVDAIAGYGIASRLEYIIMPILFGLGTTVLTMVGTNIGAGQLGRARRIALIGAAVAGAVVETIGIIAATFSNLWIGLFSTNPLIIEKGSLYLQLVAPAYGFYGIALALYFAGQGAGVVKWPVLAGTARLVLAAGVGWLAVAILGGGLFSLFAVVSAAFAVHCLISAFGFPFGYRERNGLV